MHRDGIEHGRLAGIHRMLAAGLRQRDAPCDADLAALWIGAHCAARRDGDHLEAPAAPEQRGLALEHRARQLDLRLDLRAAVVNIERRAGDRHAVIAFQPADRQVRARIGRIADVHHGPGDQAAQQVRIAVAHRTFRPPRPARRAPRRCSLRRRAGEVRHVGSAVGRLFIPPIRDRTRNLTLAIADGTSRPRRGGISGTIMADFDLAIIGGGINGAGHRARCRRTRPVGSADRAERPRLRNLVQIHQADPWRPALSRSLCVSAGARGADRARSADPQRAAPDQAAALRAAASFRVAAGLDAAARPVSLRSSRRAPHPARHRERSISRITLSASR